MKSQDIVILFKLVSLEQQKKGSFNSGRFKLLAESEVWSIEESQVIYNGENMLNEAYSNRGLESSTGISKSEVNASIKRSISVGMAKLDRKSKIPKTNVRALLEFVSHGIKYVYPANPSAIVRGIPTSFAAPVLEGKLMTAGEFIYVWPDAHGKKMGQSVEPLYKTVPLAVKKDPILYGYLALVDAIRIGAGRERAFAIKELKRWLEA